MEEELQSLYPAREPTLQASLNREKRVWVLLVRIEGLVADATRTESDSSRSLSLRVKYGDTGACEQTTIGQGQSQVIGNSLPCELEDHVDAALEPPTCQQSATFRSTCMFTWRRNFAPILRLKVRKRWGIIERTIAKNALDIPFCEERPGGSWLVRPGFIQQELVLLNKLGGGSFGHANISVEMQDIPQSELSNATALAGQIYQYSGPNAIEKSAPSLASSTPAAKGNSEAPDALSSNAPHHENSNSLGSCFGAREGSSSCASQSIVDGKCSKIRTQAWTMAM